MRKPITMYSADKGMWRQLLWIIFITFFSVLMLEITLQYVPMRFDVAFLKIKQNEVQLPYYRVAFYVHVYTSMLALLAGLTQFSKRWRIRSSVHRSVGKIYIATILCLSGPSGLIMAIHANGGWTSQVGFVLLSLLWMLFTLFAFTSAKKGQFDKHQKWIYLSYALTLSAVTLRLWKMGLVWLFAPNPMDVYRIVAWLGWVPNLIMGAVLARSRT